MFVLVLRSDAIAVQPAAFNQDIQTTLRELIDTKYANKVLPGVGLCLCMYDFDNISAGKFVPGSASAHTDCTFRLIVFRPFVGETIEGKISRQDKHGVYLSLGFFADVRIPASLLQQPSTWDEAALVWKWLYEDGRFFPMKDGEAVSFKVHKIQFATIKENARRCVATITETKESAPDSALLSRSRTRSRSLSMDLTNEVADVPPIMTIIGRCNEQGLGATAWWMTNAEDE